MPNVKNPPAFNKKPLLFIVLAAVLARIAALIILSHGCFLTATVCSPSGDQPEYLDLAHHLIDGRGFTTTQGFAEENTPYSYRPPVYPLFLAGLLQVVQQNLFWARLFQVAVTLLIPLAAFFLAKAFLSHRWALNTAYLCAVAPFFFYFSLFFLSDFLYQTLFIGGLALLFLLQCQTSRRQIWLAGFAGLSLGLASLTRSEAFYLTLVTIAFLPLLRRPWQLSWKTIAVFVAIFLLPTGIWMGRNHLLYGKTSIQNKILAVGLLNSYRSDYTGIDWPEYDAWASALSTETAAMKDGAQIDRRVAREFFNFARLHPNKFMEATAAKALQMWKIFPQADRMTGQNAYTRPYFKLVALLTYGIFIPFAVFGMFLLGRKSWPQTLLLLALVCTLTAMVAITNQAMRHRVVLMPIFYLGAMASCEYFAFRYFRAKTTTEIN